MERLQAENERLNKRFHAASILGTYGVGSSVQDHGCDFQLPPIRINGGVEPTCSIGEGGNNQRTTYDAGDEEGEIKKITLTIQEVTIIKEAQEMWSDVKEIKIPIKDTDGALLVSTLGASRRIGTKFEYAYEFGVNKFVRENR